MRAEKTDAREITLTMTLEEADALEQYLAVASGTYEGYHTGKNGRGVRVRDADKHAKVCKDYADHIHRATTEPAPDKSYRGPYGSTEF